MWFRQSNLQDLAVCLRAMEAGFLQASQLQGPISVEYVRGVLCVSCTVAFSTFARPLMDPLSGLCLGKEARGHPL